MSDKILFIKYGNFSNANLAVYQILKSEFPDYQIDVIDGWELLKKKISLFDLITNLFYFIEEYGLQIITGKKNWKKTHEWLFATSFISIYISKILQKHTLGQKYIFSFQTQSLFNGKIKNTPHFVYTDHTTLTNFFYPGVDPQSYVRSRAFIEKSEIPTYRDATLIFTFGNLIKNSLISQYQISQKKIITAYTGSNVSTNLSTTLKKKIAKSIVFVGIDWERKGGPILLKVFQKVLTKHPDATLTIVGCSPKNINLRNCTIVGKIHPQKISEYYNKASVFCLPTLREPFGMVFVEAMSYKLPIIANNVGCIPDLVINGFNGYLIDNDIMEYAKAICYLFDNPKKCLLMGENGFKYASENFTWKRVGETFKNNISKVLCENESLL